MGLFGFGGSSTESPAQTDPKTNPTTYDSDEEFFDMEEADNTLPPKKETPKIVKKTSSKKTKSSTREKKSTNEFLSLKPQSTTSSPEIDFEGIPPPDQDGPDLQLVIDQVFNLTSRQFFEFFIADHAVFSFADFHALREDEDIRVGNWQTWVPSTDPAVPNDPRLTPGSIERKMKIRLKIDTSFSRLHKMQRIVPNPDNNGFLMITHAITPDVIFGTQFSVTDVWRLEDIPGKRQCRLQIHLGALFMNPGWAITMLIPVIRGRVVNEGQEMWQHWAEVAKLRVSRLAHELLNSSAQTATDTEVTDTDTCVGTGVRGGDSTSVGEHDGDSDQDTLDNYTEDERQAARTHVNIHGMNSMSGAVFDESVLNEDMKEVLHRLRSIELCEEVDEQERELQERLIRKQIEEQQRMIRERELEKERLRNILIAEQEKIAQQNAALHQNETSTNQTSTTMSTKHTLIEEGNTNGKDGEHSNGKTVLMFDPNAIVLLSDTESESSEEESETDEEIVMAMDEEELKKHEKRVRKRQRARKRKHQLKLFKQAQKNVLINNNITTTNTNNTTKSSTTNNNNNITTGLPSAVTASLHQQTNTNSKMQLSLAEISAKEAQVASNLELQNKRMCTRECSPSEMNPCTIM